ncbi:enamine deaminase RidA (YjgF/YER057c/UK114 family) [Amaricoccus macauensis]|uniref:Enamine deaminase RidA (YjgF/YER057c/UK114 family) n=1 Tax=Amaricoccus macauensis TaxID=57001 RepID=A0A840SQT2_9RHOB|nr:RidA family protein [Amaricoccus macauensis]MBB5221703.1 enamine deaminase RidA (YjgF/YER057c/UK114 family) [Amaricoccus macauensis]
MITRIQPGTRLSHAVTFPLSGTLVMTAGEVANDTSGDITAQTKDVLAKIDALLAEAGTDKTALLSAYIWLPDIGDFAAMNAVWDAWLPAGGAPVRACVEARLADPKLKVEIQVTALKA